MIKNTTRNFIIIAVLFLFLLTLIKYPHFQNTQFMQDRWFPCVDYLKEGKLYNGIPSCSQGPVLFGSLTLLTLTGDYIYYVSFWLGILLSLLLLLLIRKLIEKETKRKPFISLIFIFGVVLYYPFLTTWLDMMLASILLLGGIYVLYHTTHKQKELLGFIILTIAILTKITNALPAIAILSHYFLTKYKLKEVSKRLLPLIITSIIIFALLFLMSPYFFHYNVLGHLGSEGGGSASALVAFLSSINVFKIPTDIYYTLTLWTLIVTFFIFCKERNQYAIAGLATALPVVIIWPTSAGVETALNYYFIPFYCLFMIMGYTLHYKLKSKPKKVAIYILIAILLCPFLFQLYTHVTFMEAKIAINKGGMDILSEKNTNILIENKPNSISVKTIFPYLNIKNKEITTITPELYPWDIIYGPRIIKSGASPETTFTKEHKYYKDHISEETFNVFAEDIKDGKFNILILQDSGFINIKDLFNKNRFHRKVKDYCKVRIPHFIQKNGLSVGSHKSTFLIKEKETCIEFAEAIYTHYKENFQAICSANKEVSEEVRKVLLENNMQMPECTKEGWITKKMYDYFTIITVY